MFDITFLNSGILILAGATIIPLIIYLFAKKKPNKIIFSSLKFIKESQKKQNKKINIKNILLLIIRMLIILLTILAIARPAIKAPILKSTDKHPKTAISIIVDNSYSMDYLVETKTDLEIAKNYLRRINKIISKNDIISIITLDKNWNESYSFNRYGEIPKELISNINITSNAEDLNSVLEISKERLKEAQIPNREIYIVSDFQEYDIDFDMDIPTFFIPTSNLDDKNNLSCQNSYLANELVERKLEQKINFQIANHSDKQQNDIILKLFLNGRTVAEKVTDLIPNQKKEENFKISIEKSGWHSGYVEVKNERLTYDNRNYFSFYYDLSPKIAVLTDLQEIPITLETILNVYTSNEDNIDLIPSSQQTYDVLDQYSSLVVYKNKDLTPKLQFLIEKLEDNNKGILYILNSNLSTEWKSYFSDFYDLTINKFNEDNEKKISMFNKFHPVSNILESEHISKLTINNFWETDFKENGIILQTNIHPLILNSKNSIIWTFDVAALQNRFYVNSVFPVIAYRCLDFLANVDFTKNQHLVGDRLLVNQEKIQLPAGETIVLSNRKIELNKPGNYKLINANNQTNKIISANINYKESDFEPIRENETNILKFLDKKDWHQNILTSRYGFEIWKTLLILVLILFFLEMYIVKSEEKKINKREM